MHTGQTGIILLKTVLMDLHVQTANADINLNAQQAIQATTDVQTIGVKVNTETQTAVPLGTM
jgi:hypothetical protein